MAASGELADNGPRPSATPGDAEKNAGNAHFKAGDYLKAAASYTKAIKLEPTNHVFYSNRAQAFLKLNKVSRALEDADKCIELEPLFVKGYHRRALALAALDRKAEAGDMCMKACEMDPSNRDLIQLGVTLRGKQFVAEVAAIRKARAAASSAAAEPAQAGATTPAANGAPNGAAASAAAPPTAPAPAAPPKPSKSKALVDLSPEEFATEVIRTTISDLLEHRTLEPRVYMQPSHKTGGKEGAKARKKSGETAPLGVFQIAKAFDSPETLAQCIPAVRQHLKSEFKAQAAAVAVLKSAIAFPRVWSNKGAKYEHARCRSLLRRCATPPTHARLPATPDGCRVAGGPSRLTARVSSCSSSTRPDGPCGSR